ncbi:EF-hand domain pair [Phytophthora infestans]|uniref:EF-hand domain pair n=1 Tax=Phytophthora infestans TaxID=4787 RepID=A0A833WRD3_PHYIN|nr:EF-hand domain pair [Phytophthora infestans]KAF4145761.1 EF-hand domain pair [Phytophthora infestans]
MASKASSEHVSSPSSSGFDEESFGSDAASEADVYSTDSELNTVQSARATRVSRRRWRRSQSQVLSTNTLLPTAEPASTSLWTTREKQFEKFRSSLLCMPVPDGVSRIEKAKGYSLHVMSVLNWVLPDSILHTSAIPAASGNNESEDDEEEEEEPLITLGVHVSLFHAVSKRFFGNTWVSPELAVDPFQIKQAKHPKDGTLRYVIENAPLNFRAYFLSDIIDADCVGVLELVAYEKDPDSKATVRVVGCGWTLLPLFARQQPVQSGTKDEPNSVPSAFSMNSSGDSVSVFTGSPRALWELHPDAWSAQEKHEGSKFYYQIVQYEPMLSIAMFLRKNELVGALDPIPGLKDGNLANIDMGKNPKMLLQEENDTTYEETLESFVKIASLVPKSVQIEEPFELHVVATRVAINLRDEIEANLVSRLRISRTAIHEGATSVEGEISARVLKIALHNGRCFRTRQFMIPLKADPNGGDTLFCVRNHSKLRGFVFHPNMAIVVVLQYTVHFRLIWSAKLKQQALEAKKPLPPDEDVVLVTMGARALVPSDGKKLYLYDKHHHATAATVEPLATLGGVLLQEQEDRRRVLHVDLLSGAACRPYSDNTLYTPPDQVTRSLQNREVSLKDSFAFCDLKITIDEEVPATDQPIEETTSLLSPETLKPESNQTEDDEYAADQWARKLLGKANDNPLLAQTLNALATSNREKRDDQRPKTPSPKKKKPKERPAEPTTVVPEAPTSELSRASKTLLTRYGYMEPHDKPPMSPTNQTTHDKRKKAKKIELIAKSVETEVNDPFKANEIRFHFAAYRACSPGAHLTEGMTCSPAPSRVYFTFQFYNFPPTRTESLRLSKAFDNGAGGEIQTFLLMRDTSANKPAQAIQLDVDTTATGNPLETRRFAEYLKWNNLYVDVWDADSLFQLGTFAIPLHELLRQGKNVKKFQAEVAISPPLGGTMASDHCGGDEGAVCSVPDTKRTVEGENIGRIQLLMSSYGLKGEHYIDQHALNQTSAAGQPSPTEAQPRKPKHRVRARPLVESNAELYRLLSQEGFYGERVAKDLRERKEPQTRQRQNFSDTNTLTPKEIAILCELFGSRKAKGSEGVQSTGVRPTRIQCDVESKTGLLALLSLRPPETVAYTAVPGSKAVEKQLVAAQESVQSKPEEQKQQPHASASDHAQRLKRVMAIATKNHLALADAFALFDVNKDGVLSRDEFIKALRSLGTVFDDLSDEDLGLLADLLDTNKDGQIAYREFRNFVREPTRMSRTEWRDHIKRIIVRAMDKGIRVHHVFAEIDTSGDGKLSYDEFERGLEQLGICTDNDKAGVRELLQELDKDQDGTISYSEFLESLGVSIEDNKTEGVKETVKDITEDVRKILGRLTKKGIGFEEVFVHFDTDRNGTLSVEEFTDALNRLLQLDEADGDTLKRFERDAVEIYVKSINADGDTKIDYREFLTACGVSSEEMRQEAASFQQAARERANRKLIKLIVRACASGMTIQEVFDQFDSNSDGTVSLTEFQRTMEKLFLGQGMTAEDAALIAARFDTNRDGVISRREFQDFGAELRAKQQSLSDIFLPHLDKLAALDPSKLAAHKWTSFCRVKLGLSPRILSTEVVPLLSYFGFVDEDNQVDTQELCALCRTIQSATSSAKTSEKEAAEERLRRLLEKAKEQGVDLKKSFAHFDANGDGEITRAELKRGLVALGCFKDMEEADSDLLLEQLDEDGSGKVDFSEFRELMEDQEGGVGDVEDQEELMTKLKALMEQAVAKGVSIDACFAHFDKDGDGNIKTEEFVTAMTELGFAADKSVICGVLKLLDRNESGTISLSEFKQLFPSSATSSEEKVDVKQPEQASAESEAAGDRKSSSTADQTTGVKLQKLLLSAEASGVDVKKCFAHFDSDNSGVITKEEFVNAMKQLPGFENVPDEETLEIVKKLDEDESGSVSLEEFEAFLRNPAPSSSSREVDVDTTEPVPRTPESDALADDTVEAGKSAEATSVDDSEQAKDTIDDVFQTEGGGDESVPVAMEPLSNVMDPQVITPEGTERPRDTTKEPSDPSSITSEESVKGQQDPTIKSSEPQQPTAKPSEYPVNRSSSFGEGKAPSSGAPFRRTNTESKAVAGVKGAEARQQGPFAAVRAATKEEMAASTSKLEDDSAVKSSLSKEASDGLAQLKKLLQTASAKGVSIQQSFHHFDKKANEFVAYDEFVTGLRELGTDFANLSVEDVVAMAKSLDCKQQNGLRVEDFASFLQTPTLEGDAPTGAEQAVKPTDTQETPLPTSSPPPLRRTDSARVPAKKPPRPASGAQSARAAEDSPSTIVQDKPEKTKSMEKVKSAKEPAVSTANQAPKDANENVEITPVEVTPGVQQHRTTVAASLDCNYAFNSNPEIRAVELKLRQTALEAYQRGILPLRVVSKFLEDADDRRGQVPGREHRRKRKSELLRVEFLQVLMELGFTLLSDRDEEHESLSEGGMPTPITRMNDHLYARQLERLSRYRQHVKSDEAKAHKQLVRAVAKTKKRQQHGNQQAEESLRRFEDEKNQLLRVLSYYRDGHKKSLVYSLLRQQVTTSLTLFPSFGDLLFFELPFTNPYNHNDRFRLELLLPSSREIAVVLDLEIVRSSEEWAFYRENLPLSYGFITSNAHIEDEMIDDHNEVVMESHDQLHLPMRLRWLDTGMEGKKSKIPVSVVIKSCSHAHTVALFNMELRPQPFVCHRVLRFSHPASSIWRWKLRYPKGKFVVCMDPSVAMELLRSGDDQASNSGLVSFKCRVGDYPALETFFVVLYDDVYYARVFEVWQIRIQSKLRVDVHAVLGQSVRHELVIKGDGGPSGHKRHVMCFTPMQHREFVQFRPAQVFTLMPQAFNRIEFAFCAVENGADTQMVMLVNLVDVETHELVGAWSVHVTLALPVITKTYDLRLPVGRAAQKKISYSNPWDQPQTIMLRSSAPKLLVPREPVLQLPSNGQAFLRLAFAARNLSESASQDIYLFINDKRTDQNEECLLFQVTYH